MDTSQSSNQTPAHAVVLSPDAGERFTIIGGGVRVLLGGESSGGAGDGPPLHRHEREDELFYVLEGRFKFSIDGREFLGAPGAFACAPRGSVHAFRNVGSTPGRLLVTCTPAGLEVPFRAVRDPEPGDARPAPTPDAVMAEFGKHGITFVGPPLEG